MKNFKNKIEKKNIEIKGLINLKKNIVLFGYNQITEFFIKNELITTCVIDKKYIKEIKKKNQIKKIKLITIDEIIPESIIINCITGINAGLIHKRFKTLGHHVFSWIQLKHALKLNKLHYWYLGNFNQFFFKNILKYQKTYEALADFRSKREYIKILSYKVTGNEKNLNFNKQNIHNQYFPEFVRFHKNSQIIDVGAYDGDTVRNFLKMGKKYKNIIAFEPNIFNFNKLKKDLNSNKKIIVNNCALGSENKLVNFHSSKDTSRIDKKGSDKIVVKTLDSLNLSPTFIKIDIEGGEKDFILGAYKTIAKHKPNLAICVYHKPEDFFEIVDKILYINKSYKLYFRHHSLGFTESVMYFMQ